MGPRMAAKRLAERPRFERGGNVRGKAAFVAEAYHSRKKDGP